MNSVVMVELVDTRGWVLLQERDKHAPVEPNKWCLVGGGAEEGESPETAAYRELEEEARIVCDDLVSLGRHNLPCGYHGRDVVDLFTAHTSVTDAARAQLPDERPLREVAALRRGSPIGPVVPAACCCSRDH